MRGRDARASRAREKCFVPPPFHQDFPGAQRWETWKELLVCAGFDPAELDAAYEREGLAEYDEDDLTEVVEHWLRMRSLG